MYKIYYIETVQNKPTILKYNFLFRRKYIVSGTSTLMRDKHVATNIKH